MGITEVQERDAIMASIQMPLEAEKKEKAKKKAESVVVGLQNTVLDEPKAKPPTSLPTSVIVTSRPSPKPVTQSLFGKEREKSAECPLTSSVATKTIAQSLLDKQMRNAVEPMSPKPPKVATARIFGGENIEQKKTPTVTTSKFFVPGQLNGDEVKTDRELPPEKSSEQPIPLGNRDASKEELEEEQKFFEMLFNFDTSRPA